MANDNQPGDKNVATPSLGEASGARSEPSGTAPSGPGTGTVSAASNPPSTPTAPSSPSSKPPSTPPPTPGSPTPPKTASAGPVTKSDNPLVPDQPVPPAARPIGVNENVTDAAEQGKIGAQVQGDQQVSPGAVAEQNGAENPLQGLKRQRENTKRYSVNASVGGKFWFEGEKSYPGDVLWLTDEQAQRAARHVTAL